MLMLMPLVFGRALTKFTTKQCTLYTILKVLMLICLFNKPYTQYDTRLFHLIISRKIQKLKQKQI